MGNEIAGEPVEEFRLGDGAAAQPEAGGGKAFAKEVGPYSIDKDPGREGIVFCGEPAGEVEAAGEGGGEVGRKEPVKERFGRGGDRSTPQHWNFAQFCSHGGQPRPGCIQCCLKCALILRYTREIVSSQIGMIAERVGKGFEEALLVFGMLDFDRSERPVIGMEFIEKKCSGVFLRGAEVQWGRVLCPEEGDREGIGNGLAGGEVAIEVNFDAVGAAGAVEGARRVPAWRFRIVLGASALAWPLHLGAQYPGAWVQRFSFLAQIAPDLFPRAVEGLRSMAAVFAVAESGSKDGAWVDARPPMFR